MRTRDGSAFKRPRVDEDDARRREGSDGFALRFQSGRGVLRLEGEAVSPFVSIDLLELAIPKLTFPFDFTGGVRSLMNKRLELERLVLRVEAGGIEDLVARRAEGSEWLGRPRLSLERDHLGVLVEYGPEGDRVPFGFRLWAVPSGRALRLVISDCRAYGPIPVPLLALAFSCLRDGASLDVDDGSFVSLPDPVRPALMAALPPRGWRLPDRGPAVLADAEILPDAVLLDYRHPRRLDDGDAVADGPRLDRRRRVEEIHLVRAGDRFLAEGDAGAARAAYSRVLANEPDNAVAAARLAMIDVVDPDMRDTALSLASEVERRSPEHAEASAVVSHGGALAGDADIEIRALEILYRAGSSIEKLAAGSRLGEILKDRDPERAAIWLEGALSARREDPETLFTLMEIFASLGLRDKVASLIPRWIAAHDSPAERGPAHLRVGRFLLEEVGDARLATRHFERAALADPASREAAWGLADSLASVGDHDRALSQYERLGRLSREGGDPRGAARALKSIGSIWMDRGDPSLAVPRLREAVDLSPSDREARARLARALAAEGRHAEAALELEAALESGRPEDPGWGRAALDLARLYVDHLDDPGSAAPWVRAAVEVPETAEAARDLLIKQLEREGRWGELTEELEGRLPTRPPPETALSLARAHIETGRPHEAIATLEAARSAEPDREDLLDALIEASRRADDAARLREALAERVKVVEDPSRRAPLLAEIGRIELDAFGDATAAAEWLRASLDDDPESLDASEGLVEALRRLGDPGALDEALAGLARRLREAGRLGEAERAVDERYRLLVAADRIDDAAALLDLSGPGLSPGVRREALFEIASRYMAAGELARARALYAAARKEPGEGGGYAGALGEAEASLRLGDHRAALDAAIAAGSGSQDLRTRSAVVAARALEALERFDEAATTLERVAENTEGEEASDLVRLAAEILSRHERHERAIAVLGRLVETDGNPANSRLLAEALGRSGDTDRMLELLEEIAPLDREAFDRLSDELSESGRFEQLAEHMRVRLDAVDDKAEVSALSVDLGRLLNEKLGDEAGAVAAFERALEAAPDNGDAAYELAGLAYRRQQWDRLEQLLERIDPSLSTPEVDLWRAREAEHRGGPDEALARYRELVAEDPSSRPAVEGLLRVASGSEHDEMVVRIGEQHTRFYGEDRVKASIHRRIGLAHMRRGEMDKALFRLEAADRLSGGDAQALQLLAAIHGREERDEEQAEVLSRLAFLVDSPERADLLARAARIQLDRLDNAYRARYLLGRAADEDPSHPEVLVGLADCAWIDGDHAAVVRHLERFQTVAPGRRLDPVRQYWLAASAFRTGAWPAADVIELVERLVPDLDGETRRAALDLVEAARGGSGTP